MYNAVILLQGIFDNYRETLKACAARYKPGDGIFGIGHSIKDDPCHKQFDDAVSAAVDEIALAEPVSEETEEAIRFLFSQGKDPSYPAVAQLMLFAEERHILRLIPFLSDPAAQKLFREYKERYKTWERLPAQREVFKALKARC